MAATLLAFVFCALGTPGEWVRDGGGVRVALAQIDHRFPFLERRGRRPPPPQESGSRRGFFPFFNWGGPRIRVLPDEPEPRSQPQQQQRRAADPTRPPGPEKREAEPARTVVVLGDTMADWLAYGLEGAFEDTDEFGAVRKIRHGSSLIRSEPRDFDWVPHARETLAGERADFVVMMIGLSDRHAIKEKPAAAPGSPGQPQPITPNNPQQPNIMKPETERAGLTHEFRSEKWAELYGKRVAEMIAALKNKRVPVLVVGVPPIRGPKSRSDLSVINDILKAEAERAGAIYVDVWEGFLDEAGDYSSYGPDVMGQARRLRSSDGVYFTKAGARKLAHFVDREIRRLASREMPIALPLPEMPEKAPDDLLGPAPRPVAGPVVPLTGAAPLTEGLLGGPASGQRETNAAAAKVLIKGEAPEPISGRADSFSWPPARAVSENDVLEPPQHEATAARASRPAGARATMRARRPGQQPAAAGTPNAPLNLAPPPAQQQNPPRAAGAPGRPVR